MKNLTISSLAILKANYDVGRHDFIDNLRPFVFYVLAKRNRNEFDEALLQQDIFEVFALKIPQRPLSVVLGRLTREKLLSKSNRRYRKVSTPDNTGELEAHRAEYIRHGEALLKRLVEHVKSQFSLSWTTEDAEAALSEYIDEYSVQCIGAYSDGVVYPVQGKSPKNSEFILSSFIHSISSSSPHDFDYLITVIKGRMLGNAFLGSDLESVQMTLRKTTVFLDAPLIFDLLGVNGPKGEALVGESLSLIKDAKGRLAIYRHTIEEVENYLKLAERELELRGAGRGEAVLSLKDLNLTPSDLALKRSQLRSILGENKIVVRESRDYSAKFQIDEAALEKEFNSAGLFYRSEASKRFDINSIRCIFEERAGSRPGRLEDCSAVFLTSNRTLSAAAFVYGRQHEEGRSVSAVITDFSLSTLLWLKSPLARPDLAEKMVFASCYGALKPSQRLWAAFVRELDKLKNDGRIDAQAHQALRFDLRVQSDLMELTFGDEANLSEEILSKVVEAAEGRIRKPVEEKLAAERKRHEDTRRKLEVSDRELRERSAHERALRIKAIWLRESVRKVTRLVLAAGLIALIVIGRWPFDRGLLGSLAPSIRYLATALILGMALIGGFSSWKIWTPLAWLADSAASIAYRIACRHFEIGDFELPASPVAGNPGLTTDVLPEEVEIISTS